MESLVVPSPQTLSEQLFRLREQQTTCSLRVHDGWREGALRVEHGEIACSSFGELTGPAALDAMLAAGDSLLFAVLPDEPAARPADESMVVPISTWTDAPGDPAATVPAVTEPAVTEPAVTEPAVTVLEEVPAEAAASITEDHAAIVVEERQSATPPALKLRQDIPLSETSESPAATQPPEPAAPATRKVRTWVGAIVALALLLAIVLARSLEDSSPVAAVSQPDQPPAAVSGETTTQTDVSAATAQAAQPSAAAPAAQEPARSLESPIAPAGALAPTIQGRVLVGPEGRVQQTELLARRHGFAAAEEQALEIARGYRFEPQASDSWLTVPVQFRPTPPVRRVTVKGSDTLGVSVVPAWAEALRRSQPQVRVQVESLGTTPGFAALLDGSADVAAASRLIRSDELALTEKLGMQLREVYVGYDAVALIVHPSNPVGALDMDAIARIFTQQHSHWSELGGPNLPIHAIGRPGYSGTHRFFKERVLTRLGPDTGFGAKVAMFEQARDVVAEVARDPSAVGYVSFAQAEAGVRIVPLASSKPGESSMPTPASVRDGSYPLLRALVMYLRPDSSADAHALVDFALGAEGQSILAKHGFVPLPWSMTPALAVDAQVAAAARGSDLIRIYFEPNSVAIARDSRSDLNAAGMAARAQRSVVVVGNADASGDAEANRRLAQRRAEAVAAKLRDLGSRDATITVQVAAADHPIASNQTSDGRRANRRVDVIIR